MFPHYQTSRITEIRSNYFLNCFPAPLNKLRMSTLFLCFRICSYLIKSYYLSRCPILPSLKNALNRLEVHQRDQIPNRILC